MKKSEVSESRIAVSVFLDAKPDRKGAEDSYAALSRAQVSAWFTPHELGAGWDAREMAVEFLERLIGADRGEGVAVSVKKGANRVDAGVTGLDERALFEVKERVVDGFVSLGGRGLQIEEIHWDSDGNASVSVFGGGAGNGERLGLRVGVVVLSGSEDGSGASVVEAVIGEEDDIEYEVVEAGTFGEWDAALPAWAAQRPGEVMDFIGSRLAVFLTGFANNALGADGGATVVAGFGDDGITLTLARGVGGPALAAVDLAEALKGEVKRVLRQGALPSMSKVVMADAAMMGYGQGVVSHGAGMLH